MNDKTSKSKPIKHQLLAPIGVMGQNNMVTFIQNAKLINENKYGSEYSYTQMSKKNSKGIIPETVEIIYKLPPGMKKKSIPINADKILKLGQHSIISSAELQTPGRFYGLFYINLVDQVIRKKYKGQAPANGITKEEIKEERKVTRDAIEYLKRTGATIIRNTTRINPTTKKREVKAIPYDITSIIQTEITDMDEPGIIWLRLNSDLTDYILDITKGNAKRLINLTDAGLAIDAKHPNPYSIHMAIMRQYNNYANRTETPGKKATNDRLKVQTLLKATNYNLTLKEMKAKKKNWKYYKRRLENDLNYLIEVGAIDDWGYIKELSPTIKSVSRFEILNTEPRTDTERDKLEAIKNEMEEIDTLEKGQRFYSFREWKESVIYFKVENPTDENFEAVKALRMQRIKKAIERKEERAKK